MTREEHLLVIIAEECSEIAKHCTKALRFGLDSGYPNDVNNAQGIVLEFLDLSAVIEMLRESSEIMKTAALSTSVDEVLAVKKAKVETFLVYSAERGRLTK
jgi:hypothetical protein